MSGIIAALSKIGMSILMSLITEAVAKKVIAGVLEVWIKSSKTTLDDKLLGPVIEELKK